MSSRLRWPIRVLALLLAFLAIAWLAFPVWAPPLAATRLPDGWMLETVDLERPGPAGLRIASLVLVGSAAGLPLRIAAQGTRIRYRGPGLELDRLQVQFAQPLPPDGAALTRATPWRLEDFAVPRLLWPGLLPEIRVRRLDLIQEARDSPQQWTFENVDLAAGGRGLRLNGDMQQPPWLRVPASFDLRLDAGRLGLKLFLGVGNRLWPLLEFRESVSAAGPAEGTIRGALSVNGDLAWMDPAQISRTTAGTNFGEFQRLSGRIELQAEFEGRAGADSPLLPRGLEIDLQNLLAVTQQGQLGLNLAATLEANPAQVEYRISRLEGFVDGQFPGFSGALARGLQAVGVGGLRTDEALVARIDTTGLVEGHLEREDLRDHVGAGDLRVSWAQGTGWRMTLDLEEARWSFVRETGSSVATRMTGAMALGPRLEYADANRTVRLDNLRGAFQVQVKARRPLGFDRALPQGTFIGRIDRLTLDALSVEQDDLAVALTDLALGGDFRVENDRWQFSGPVAGTDLRARTRVDGQAQPGLEASSFRSDLDVRQEDALVLDARSTLDGFRMVRPGLAVDSLDLALEDFHLPALEGSFSLLTAGLSVPGAEQPRRGADLDLQGRMEAGDRVRGTGSLLLGLEGELPFSLEGELESGSFSAELQDARLDAAGIPAALRFLQFPVPGDLSFQGGALVLDGVVTLAGDTPTGHIDLRGEALQLALGESTIDGLFFTTSVDLGDTLTGGGGLELRLLRLAAGLDLVSLETGLELGGGSDFGAIELKAGLLDGIIEVPALRFTGGDLEPTSLAWNGLDLGRLLSFMDVSGLEGGGRIDATMPLRTEGGAPVVEDGRFEAQGPGFIRYRSAVPAGNIGLQALENFEYETLTGTLAYGADGAYLIGLDLLGRNPDLYGGYPIRFRLNLSGELPALARSLFVTGDFGQAILEQLKSGALEAAEGQD